MDHFYRLHMHCSVEEPFLDDWTVLPVLAVDDPRLQERVADNLAKHEITQSKSLLIVRNLAWY